MKILLAVSCPNELNYVRLQYDLDLLDEITLEYPQYGLLEITPEYAAQVLETAKAVQPLCELRHFYSAEFSDCSVVYGYLPEDYADNDQLAELVSVADEKGYALIPEGLTFEVGEKCDGSDEGFQLVLFRTESGTIVYTNSGVFYTAVAESMVAEFDPYPSYPLAEVDRHKCFTLPIGLFEAVAGAAV
jgi:hypothetical protein